MFRILLRISVLAGFLILIERPAMAQEIVHAFTGTVSAIDPSQKSITILQDGGSETTYKVMASPKTRVAFDKRIEGEVTAAAQFEKKGAYVILFYFGMDPNRTAIAVKNLGAGPFSSTTGNVASWDGRSHKLVVTGKDGSTHSFDVEAQSVAETYRGATSGYDFRPEKGDRVRVVSTVKDGTAIALFIGAT